MFVKSVVRCSKTREENGKSVREIYMAPPFDREEEDDDDDDEDEEEEEEKA